MRKTKSTKAYWLKQLGTPVEQLFEFTFTPRSVTSNSLCWFGMDELAIIEILALRTEYLYSIRACSETADALAWLKMAEDEIEVLMEELSQKKAKAFKTTEVVTGHVFEIASHRNSRRTITFLRRSGGFVTYDTEWPGIQSQEVLRMLIARMKELGRYIGHNRVSGLIYSLRMVLASYEIRARRRKEAQVNRLQGDHDDEARIKPWQEPLLTTHRPIESLPTDSDGHIKSTN